MIKVFGMGDFSLGDDSIGARTIEYLKDEIENLSQTVKVIIGSREEKNYFEEINKDDFIIIVDSGSFGKKIGGITNISLVQCDNLINGNYNLEKESFINVLRKDYRHIKGVLIAIEVMNIQKQAHLSIEIQKCFDKICKRVLDIIKYLVKISS
ncbi:hydrogenase maturation protease [Clostridium tarantellae]|nr:hydrogenase maturation protease [Clostridium tarantellae]